MSKGWFFPCPGMEFLLDPKSPPALCVLSSILSVPKQPVQWDNHTRNSSASKNILGQAWNPWGGGAVIHCICHPSLPSPTLLSDCLATVSDLSERCPGGEGVRRQGHSLVCCHDLALRHVGLVDARSPLFLVVLWVSWRVRHAQESPIAAPTSQAMLPSVAASVSLKPCTSSSRSSCRIVWLHTPGELPERTLSQRLQAWCALWSPDSKGNSCILAPECGPATRAQAVLSLSLSLLGHLRPVATVSSL